MRAQLALAGIVASLAGPALAQAQRVPPEVAMRDAENLRLLQQTKAAMDLAVRFSFDCIARQSYSLSQSSADVNQITSSALRGCSPEIGWTTALALDARGSDPTFSVYDAPGENAAMEGMIARRAHDFAVAAVEGRLPEPPADIANADDSEPRGTAVSQRFADSIKTGDQDPSKRLLLRCAGITIGGYPAPQLPKRTICKILAAKFGVVWPIPR